MAQNSAVYRARPRKTFSTTTTVAFSCVACCVVLLFCVGHNNIVRMHNAMESPLKDPPAGWGKTQHRTTTVQSATVTIKGSEITGSALTATTTETTSASKAASTSSKQHAVVLAGHASNAKQQADAVQPANMKGSLSHMLGDLQSSVHAMLAYGGWRPGDAVTRAQLAAAAAATMPDEGRDIELHAHKVAAVVDRAKQREQLQAVVQADGTVAAAAAVQPAIHTAEAYANLYGPGTGTVVFSPHDDLGSCPEGTVTPLVGQAAVVLLAGSSTAALKRSLDGMMLRYSRASPDVRAAFQLYVGLDSEDDSMRQMAHDYAIASVGAVRLVHHSRKQEHASTNKLFDEGKHPVAQGTTSNARGSSSGSSNGSGSQAANNSQHTSSSSSTTTTTGGKKPLAVPAAAELPQGDSSSKPSEQERPTVSRSSNSRRDSTLDTTPSIRTSSATTSSNAVAGSRYVRSEHTRLMLHVFLDCFKYPAVLFLEDDLKLAPDFFDFYAATLWLLDSDSSLFCLSAWNPLGHRAQRVHPAQLLRTDAFPGRSWLISRQVGLQLLGSWPQSELHGWQRYVQGEVMKAGRQCLVPEMPRVAPAGTHEPDKGAHLHDQQQDSKKVVVRDTAVLPWATSSSKGKASSSVASSSGNRSSGSSSSSDGSKGSSSSSTSGDRGGSQGKASSGGDSNGGLDINTYIDFEDMESEASVLDQSAIVQQQAPKATIAAGSTELRAASDHEEAAASAWMNQDLSVLFADSYEAHMLQVLLAAQPCDVAAASVLQGSTGACRVSYSSAAYLLTTAHRLGIPITIQQGILYCYQLPGAPNEQHCQDYMPDASYHGVVLGYNRHGAAVFMMHAKYMEALQAATQHSAKGTAATAAVGVQHQQ